MENLEHFENCAIAVKTSRQLVNTNNAFYEQMLNEIRICSKIGYHENICTMLGYVSTDRLTCLLLELAQTDVLSALKSDKFKSQEMPIIIRYLHNIAIQIADGMVSKSFLQKIFLLYFQLFISAKKLIHRDVAARNVLLTSENRAMVIIAFVFV